MVQKPAGYQAILNYWRNTGPKPSTNAAMNGLMALAQPTRLENCVLHPDVFDALLRPEPHGVTLPFKSHSVPGVIFAADYDLGRPGEAYLDQSPSDPHNSGNAYRNDSVDIESGTDASPTIGFNVGWLEAGDWMKYSVKPAAPGPYAFSARVAANSPGGSFYLEAGGSNLTGNITVPATGGWQTWTTLPARVFTNTVPLTSFRLVIVSGSFNLNWVRFESVLPAAPSGISATATNTHAALFWHPSAGAMAYNIQRASTEGGPYTLIASGVTFTNYVDWGVTNGVTYHYVIRALNAFGESVNSSSATTTVPFPRLNLSASPVNLGLSWANSASPLRVTMATNLASPIVWSPLTNEAIQLEGTWSLLLSAVENVQFFRLATP